jgi:GT2 family glycosyltransferase
MANEPNRAGDDTAASEATGMTVLFATHNGARTLPRMLAALEKLQPPRRPLRFVVVDNASTDRSGELLRAAKLPAPVEVLHSAIPGKVSSLLVGLRRVSGDLVVFTDDDVEPVPSWLVAYEQAADRHPDAGLFGGPITPQPIDPVTPWFEACGQERAVLFADTQVKDGPIEDPAAQIFGPNYMLRRRHLNLVSKVGASLGPTFAAQGRYPMGEDTLVMLRAQSQGVRAHGVAGAEVRHMVRGHQTELDFMLSRAMRHGRGWAIRYAGVSSPSARRRLKLLAMGLAGSLTFTGRAVAQPSAFDRLWRAYWMRGVVLGAVVGPFADVTGAAAPDPAGLAAGAAQM